MLYVLFHQRLLVQLTGGCDKLVTLRQWISLCTAPVHPLPANTTQSCSDAFTALRIINLDEHMQQIRWDHTPTQSPSLLALFPVRCFLEWGHITKYYRGTSRFGTSDRGVFFCRDGLLVLFWDVHVASFLAPHPASCCLPHCKQQKVGGVWESGYFIIHHYGNLG